MSEQHHWLSDLRRQHGLSQEALARRIMVDTGTVGRWERGIQEIRASNVALLADALNEEIETIWAFVEGASKSPKPESAATEEAVGDPTARTRSGPSLGSSPADRDLRTVDFVAWLAERSSTDFQTIYQEVAAAAEGIAGEAAFSRRAREHANVNVTRADLAAAIAAYYDLPTANERLYGAEVAGTQLVSSILIKPTWLDVAVQLGTAQERATYRPPLRVSATELPTAALQAAILRLAMVEATGTVMVNNPIYRLLSIDIRPGLMDFAVTHSDFASYSLASDLMESELVKLVSRHDADAGPDQTPLRDHYLPSVGAAMDLEARICAGGPVALMAIARPARGNHPADYALLIQTRSSRVLNAAQRLAVIPKAFHQPISEPSGEADIAATLLRELEEELLGRSDLEQLSEESWRKADALHQHHRLAPTQWLLDRLGATFHTECTGFGINLITGTFEFSCLVVIDDESWWTEWGHVVEANWEVMRLQRYSSRDTDGLISLAHDPRWSNEGLFGFLQGLRRLKERDRGNGRVAAPPIQMEN